jgi:hypothetical protein
VFDDLLPAAHSSIVNGYHSPSATDEHSYHNKYEDLLYRAFTIIQHILQMKERSQEGKKERKGEEDEEQEPMNNGKGKRGDKEMGITNRAVILGAVIGQKH